MALKIRTSHPPYPHPVVGPPHGHLPPPSADAVCVASRFFLSPENSGFCLPICRYLQVKCYTGQGGAVPVTSDQPGPDDNLNVMNCALSFECSLKWTDLMPTKADNVRHCGMCDQNVTLCRTMYEFARCAGEGICVAFYPAAGTEILTLDARQIRMGIPRMR